MEQPLVTVVTVTYNSSAYVRDAMDSVLAQDYANIEYIVGDDCSTDETWSIIREYNDPRIVSYQNDKNLGEYTNRNKAIEKATGKYLIFIDGDDIIFQHGIGFFVRMMEGFPEAGMAIQKNYYNNILYPALLSSEEILLNYFYGSFNILSSSFASDFFRTDLLKQWKLSTLYKTGDDEIRFKFAASKPILFVAGWVTWPRETPGQASTKINTGMGLAEAYHYVSETLADPGKNRVNQELLKDMLAVMKRRIARFAVYLLLRGKWTTLNEFLTTSGFTWKEAMRYYSYKTSNLDSLIGYTSTNPFKNGFLRKSSMNPKQVAQPE